MLFPKPSSDSKALAFNISPSIQMEEQNIAGALLFYGYIVAAIGSILLIMGNTWSFKERTATGRNLYASLYAALAQISFVMLSNNMASQYLQFPQTSS